MKPFHQFPENLKKQIAFVLTDVDDTLTVYGKLPALALAAMERLQDKGIRVIPVTGRPAGWCDHMARMWPIDGVIGENGAFYFRYDAPGKQMLRCFAKTPEERDLDRSRLEQIKHKILNAVPGARVSADQAFRVADMAIDFCEDVPRLSDVEINRIVRIFQEAGAQAKISSIHVNGWFGDYDKYSMAETLFKEIFCLELQSIKDRVLFSGDSPNDAPLFAAFPHSVGMANILAFRDRLAAAPAWVTSKEGGHGFAEMVEILLSGDHPPADSERP